MKRKILIVAMVLMLLLSACGMDFDDTAIRQETAAILDGLIAGDYDAVRTGLSDRIADSDLRGVFEELSRDLEGLGDYEISPQQWKITSQDGMKLTAIRYLVTAGETRFYIDATKVDGERGIAGFHVSSAEVSSPGTVSSGVMGWVVTGVGIAAWGFALWMAVDCLRRRMKRKWLWLPLILLVWMTLTLSLIQGTASIRFNFGIRIGISSLITYADGSRALGIYLPLGAIAYFCTREKLTIKPQPVPVPEVPGEFEAE